MCIAILALPGLDFVGGTHFDANINGKNLLNQCSNRRFANKKDHLKSVSENFAFM
jgi:hypothetical protein